MDNVDAFMREARSNIIKSIAIAFGVSQERLTSASITNRWGLGAMKSAPRFATLEEARAYLAQYPDTPLVYVDPDLEEKPEEPECIVAVGGTRQGFLDWVRNRGATEIWHSDMLAIGPGWRAQYIGHQADKLKGITFNKVKRLGSIDEHMAQTIRARSITLGLKTDE